LLKQDGAADWRTSPDDLREMLHVTMPAAMRGWKRKRIAFFAHGGMNDAQSGMSHAALWRQTFLDAEIYPVFFVWRSGFFESIANIIADHAAKSIFDDEIDDALEKIGRDPIKPIWDEMKQNALRASVLPNGGARLAAGMRAGSPLATEAQIHLLGHSAGSILLAPFGQLLDGAPIEDGPLAGERGYGLNLSTASLWAPGISCQLFKQIYAPMLRRGALKTLGLYTLSDAAERKDTLRGVYNKSILYFVSNALEVAPRWQAQDGYPLLGMEKFVRADPEITELIKNGQVEWVVAPHSLRSNAAGHLDFSRDPDTLQDSLRRMLAF
jgi:hypothetical protein